MLIIEVNKEELTYEKHKRNQKYQTFKPPPLSGKSLTCGSFWDFRRAFFEGKKRQHNKQNVMLNSFQHLIPVSPGNKEIPKQVRNDNRGAAFTLAEVLITLVIIGVIAALTLPTLIGKYQKHQTVVGLKKAYSEVSNAVRMSVAENGDVSTWEWTLDEAWLNKYILPYFKIINTMTMEEAKEKAGGVYYEISGQPETNLGILKNAWPAKVITLPSGAQLWMGYNQGDYKSDYFYGIYLDINGSKKPNTFGKDVFVTRFWRDNGQVLFDVYSGMGIDLTKTRTIEKLKQNNNTNRCNKNGRGIWCGALIQAEGWEIKDDYPW